MAASGSNCSQPLLTLQVIVHQPIQSKAVIIYNLTVSSTIFIGRPLPVNNHAANCRLQPAAKAHLIEIKIQAKAVGGLNFARFNPAGP